MKKSVIAKIKKIKLLILDVDGVLTDGSINIDHEGQETKRFNVQDGFGVVILKRAGFKTAILSARSARAVVARAEDLKFDKIVQDAQPKLPAFEKLIKELKVKAEEACFIGDDIPDIAVLKRAGFSVTVPDGASEAKRIADYVTKSKGGHGAVREVVELILKTQNQWNNIVKHFS